MNIAHTIQFRAHDFSHFSDWKFHSSRINARVYLRNSGFTHSQASYSDLDKCNIPTIELLSIPSAPTTTFHVTIRKLQQISFERPIQNNKCNGEGCRKSVCVCKPTWSKKKTLPQHDYFSWIGFRAFATNHINNMLLSS